MADGNVTNDSFAPPMFRDPAIRAFMQKITVREDPALAARIGAAVPTQVTAVLTDGRSVAREIDYAPGFAERPMTRGEVETKFRGNVGKRWSTEQTDAVLAELWQFERIDDLARFLGMFTVQAGR